MTTKALSLMLLCAVAACSMFDPARSLYGTYRLVGCAGPASSETTPVPCTSYQSGSSHWVADSGALVLHADGTANWMLATTTTSNPCYLGGTSCPSTGTGIDSSAGTYRVARDSIIVHLLHAGSSGEADRVFLTRISADASNAPDSLTLNLSNGAYLGVFKP